MYIITPVANTTFCWLIIITQFLSTPGGLDGYFWLNWAALYIFNQPANSWEVPFSISSVMQLRHIFFCLHFLALPSTVSSAMLSIQPNQPSHRSTWSYHLTLALLGSLLDLSTSDYCWSEQNMISTVYWLIPLCKYETGRTSKSLTSPLDGREWNSQPLATFLNAERVVTTCPSSLYNCNSCAVTNQWTQ